MLKHWIRNSLIGVLGLGSLPSAAYASDSATGLTQQHSRGVVSTLGIPYAKPPVGNLRWRAPQPLDADQPIQNLGYFGPSCAQNYLPALGDNNIDTDSTSEDCLYLNVWAPEDAGTHLYPVLVWLHGGGFRIGGAALPLYNGKTLAAQGVVVVSLNYRMGILGFFAHPSVTEQGRLSGNFGLQDQIAALTFVREHIAKLGGDASNITLVGESAGAASTLYLMASEASHKRDSTASLPLFDKAIVQSGAIDLPEYDRQRMEEIATNFTRDSGLAEQNSPVSAKQLRELPLAEVLAAEPTSRAATMPYIDGTGIGRSIYQTFNQGEQLEVPLLIGSNSYEAGFFPEGFSMRLLKKMSAKQWQLARSLSDGYGREGDYWHAAQLATDLFATLGTRQVARDHAALGVPTFRYFMSYVPPSQRDEFPGTIHTADVHYLFGNEMPADARPFSQQLQKSWIQFARTGNPSLPDLQLNWPGYSAESEQLLLMENNGDQVGSDPAPARLDYLQSLDSLQIN